MMKIQSRILLIRTRENGRQGCSAVVSAGVLYWRPMASPETIESALEREEFQLVVLDHGSAAGNAIAAVETLRVRQRKATLLLVSDTLELQDVVKAMRIGVREVFLAPLDLGGLIRGVESCLGESCTLAPDPTRWTVLGEFLEAHEETQAEAPTEAAPADVEGRECSFADACRPDVSADAPSTEWARALADANADRDAARARAGLLESELEKLTAAFEDEKAQLVARIAGLEEALKQHGRKPAEPASKRERPARNVTAPGKPVQRLHAIEEGLSMSWRDNVSLQKEKAQ